MVQMVNGVQQKWTNISTTKKIVCLHCCALFIVLVYFLPYILNGENTSLPFLDNLDSNITWIKVLIDNNVNIFNNNASINNALTNLPISSYTSYYDISLTSFYLFGIYWGYVINKIVIALVAYYGMFLFVNNFLFAKKDIKVSFLAAILFAVQPFWGVTFSVAILPLMFYGFFTFLYKKNIAWHSWLIMIIVPFCSSLFLTGIFCIVIFTLLLAIKMYKQKKLNYTAILALIVQVLFYVISHWPIISTYLFGFVSHRVNDVTVTNADSFVFKHIVEEFLYGSNFTHSCHKFLIIPIVVVLFYLGKYKRLQKIYFALLGFIILSTLFHCVYTWGGFVNLKILIRKIIPITPDRFYWLQPFCWYLLLAIVFYYLKNAKLVGKYLLLCLAFFQLAYLFKQNEAITNRKLPSVKAFYATQLFAKIEQKIAKPKTSYRVASIGIFPNIALHNGFYTIDGFLVNYPLGYRQQFLKIMEPSNPLKDINDGSSNQCYLYNTVTKDNMFIQKNNTLVVNDLGYNFNQMKNLGAQYIFSTVQLTFTQNSPLEFIEKFDDENTCWSIYLYRIM